MLLTAAHASLPPLVALPSRSLPLSLLNRPASSTTCGSTSSSTFALDFRSSPSISPFELFYSSRLSSSSGLLHPSLCLPRPFNIGVTAQQRAAAYPPALSGPIFALFEAGG
ncbi:uncharacterized protein UTRI_05547 [Ustilago trichophora]|uniref:Uncharacterized protein n=1 Tax=Ustilago trichophora TaxID=86804 RepID=A0A5C3EI22_9BASI|nr:uncharacterized protein UTRI_05547 [Ustilago trichophora]